MWLPFSALVAESAGRIGAPRPKARGQAYLVGGSLACILLWRQVIFQGGRVILVSVPGCYLLEVVFLVFLLDFEFVAISLLAHMSFLF